MTQSEDEVPDASPSYRRAEEATIRVWRLKYPRLRLMPAEWDKKHFRRGRNRTSVFRAR